MVDNVCVCVSRTMKLVEIVLRSERREYEEER
jgi:hypothetical protein